MEFEFLENELDEKTKSLIQKMENELKSKDKEIESKDKKIDDLKKIEYTNNFQEFEWSNVLEKSNLYEFIMEIKN